MATYDFIFDGAGRCALSLWWPAADDSGPGMTINGALLAQTSGSDVVGNRLGKTPFPFDGCPCHEACTVLFRSRARLTTAARGRFSCRSKKRPEGRGSIH